MRAGARRAYLAACLAARDLLHELPLNLCVLLALSAVMAPLLITFGLKNGTVKTLRDRLSNDPDKREIIVRSSFDHPAAWMDALRGRPDVGFVIPRTRPLSNEITLRAAGKSSRVSLEPTGAGDPVLSYAGIRVPGDREIVVSGLVADDLGVSAGDPVTLAVESYGRNARREEIAATVSGILPGRGRRAAFAPLPVLETVERIKDGAPAAAGTAASPEPLYRGVLLLAGQPLSAELQSRILSLTGLGSIRLLAPDECLREAGWPVAGKQSVWLVSSKAASVNAPALDALREILRGENTEVLPWVPPAPATIQSPTGRSQLLVAGLSISPESAKKRGLPAPPWGGRPDNIYQVVLPKDAGAPPGNAEILMPSPLPLAVAGTWENPGVALVPAELAGILARPDKTHLRFDAAAGGLVLERRGYSWMRIYARSIDDVDPLRRYLESEGVEVSTEAERIREVAEIDRHLSRIFVALAGVGLVGGMSALVASLFAGAERKRREFGVMRLLGLPRDTVALFPVFQGAIISAGSYLAAIGIFSLVSVGINALFQDQLRPGEGFCRLGGGLLAAGFGATLLVAVASGLAASARIGRQAPSESLREP